MNNNLESRLRAELTRTGRSARVADAPTVDELASVARGRQQRNRVLAAGGAVVCFGGVLIGSFLAAQPDTTTDVVAGGGEATLVEEADEVAPASDAGPSDEPQIDVELIVDEDGTVIGQKIERDGEIQFSTTVAPPAASASNEVVSAQNAAIDIETRDSAVAFAGGSGVFLVPEGPTFAGVASRFGADGVEAIGLRSSNGLDWEEVELEGIPAGATATMLRSYAGQHVALFSKPSGVGNTVYVGVSGDLTSWELAEPLAGSEVFALHLAVGPGGVVVLGDDFDRAVWSGPVGGPYERRDPLSELGAISGVAVVDGEFVVVGRSTDGTKVLTSSDGESWGIAELELPGDSEEGRVVQVVDDTIVVTESAGVAPVTYVSADGGQSWDGLDVGSVTSVSAGESSQLFVARSETQTMMTFADAGGVVQSELDLPAAHRLEILSVDDSSALMLVTTENGLTWVRVSR